MTSESLAIPAGIRDLLACPKCRGPLQDGPPGAQGAHPWGNALLCGACRLSYPVDAGIPVLLIERATPYTSQG